MSDNFDEAIQERIVALTNMALDEAFAILKTGPPARKDALIRTIITHLSSRMRKETGDELADMRVALQDLFGQNRNQGEQAATLPDQLNGPRLSAPTLSPDDS